MDQGWFEVCGASKGEQHVCMQSADKSPSKSKPLVIHFTRDASTQKPQGFQPIPGVTNISGTSSMTRSRRIFPAPDLLVRSKDTKGKAKVSMEESD